MRPLLGLGLAPRLAHMMVRRICLWLLLALAIPAQSVAVYSLRFPCFDQSGSAAPAVEMECHTAATGHASEQPDCCGDSCPDMTACAALHAAGLSVFTQVLPDSRSVLVDRYALPLMTALFAAPFRPPVFSHA